MIQCTHTRFGALGSGASGSSRISARLLVPCGAPLKDSGGETSSPSQVYFDGILSPDLKAEDESVRAMAVRPASATNKVRATSRLTAKRMTAVARTQTMA